MGLLLSRFKKKKSTEEILEKLVKDITSIEKYRTHTEQRQRRIVGQLVVYSVGVYVLAALLFYFYWFPNNFTERLLYVTPLLFFPILVILLKKLVTFYYSRKITKNEQKICDLRAEKKKILEEVMDKETYKVARTILEKFAPEQLRSKGMDSNLTLDKSNLAKTPLKAAPIQTSTPSRPALPMGTAPTELRRRTLPPGLGNQGAHPLLPSSLSSDSLSTAVIQRSQFLAGTPMHRPSINGQSFSSDYRPSGPPLPRPIPPRERGYLERFTDYIVADGPSNRYALICSSCDSHNGMALKEEFEYLSFRCCYCHYFNPARKQRPQAPRLSPISGSRTGQQISSASGNEEETSDSEKYSGSDSSDENEGPEPQPINTSGSKEDLTEGLKTAIQQEQDTSLDREAEEFLKALNKGDKNVHGELEVKEDDNALGSQ